MSGADQETDALFKHVNRLIKHGEIVAIRTLLDGGLSPNFANKFGWTILILAAAEGNTSLGELLISRGADVNLAFQRDLNVRPLTPFDHAIIAGRIGFAKLLLDHGAIPDHNLAGWLPRTVLTQKQAEKVLAMVREADARRQG
jgi:ankyrin repeat protein